MVLHVQKVRNVNIAWDVGQFRHSKEYENLADSMWVL
jgi:hypothetical protein